MSHAELPVGVEPIAHEWLAKSGQIRLYCGCVETVHLGDTVWALPVTDGFFVPLWIERPTLQ
jgi:hypothetical protein